MPTTTRAPQWIAGDATQNSLFELARGAASIHEAAKQSKILWLGISAIFLAANYLGTDGDFAIHFARNAESTNFDLITSLGLGYAGARTVHQWYRQRKAARILDASLSQISAKPVDLTASAERIEGDNPTVETWAAIKRLSEIRAAKKSSPSEESSNRPGPKP